MFDIERLGIAYLYDCLHERQDPSPEFRYQPYIEDWRDPDGDLTKGDPMYVHLSLDLEEKPGDHCSTIRSFAIESLYKEDIRKLTFYDVLDDFVDEFTFWLCENFGEDAEANWERLPAHWE